MLSSEELSLKDDSGGETVMFRRTLCWANTASLRYYPGAPPPHIATIYQGELIEVLSSDGVWYRATKVATGQTGYTLAEYYC